MFTCAWPFYNSQFTCTHCVWYVCVCVLVLVCVCLCACMTACVTHACVSVSMVEHDKQQI